MSKPFNGRFILFIASIIGVMSLMQCTQSLEKQLKSIAAEANKQCPYMLDQWTRLDSCVAFGDKNYKYYHTILGVVVSDTSLFKQQLAPQIVKTVKISPDMVFFRENNITLNYSYRDQANKYLFSVVVTPEDYK